MSFTGETTLEQGFSGNLDRLRRAIDQSSLFRLPATSAVASSLTARRQSPGTNQALAGSTAIWDAVYFGRVDRQVPRAHATRNLLTDGDDTSSRLKMDEAIEAAQKVDALIYAIGIGDRYVQRERGAPSKDRRKNRRPGLFSKTRAGPARRLHADSPRPPRAVPRSYSPRNKPATGRAAKSRFSSSIRS